MEEMIDTSGFYKRDGEQLLYGPNFVLNADYELRRETREQNALPVDGWQWFDTAAEAYAAHGLSMPESEADNKVQNTGLGSAVLPRAHDAGMAVSYDDIVRLFSAVDVSAQPPHAAMERLGLALSNEDSLT